jgi:hypothetical protein
MPPGRLDVSIVVIVVVAMMAPIMSAIRVIVIIVVLAAIAPAMIAAMVILMPMVPPVIRATAIVVLSAFIVVNRLDRAVWVDRRNWRAKNGGLRRRCARERDA